MKLSSVVLILSLWAGLFLLGYPAPYVDDLYFVGTAINLAQGHGYANPYLLGLNAVGAHDHFYSYVPLHAYTLAAWIQLFGVSRWSFDLFQCTLGALASIFLVELFDCQRLKLFCALILALTVAIILCWSGLRPDALGLTLFLGGTLLLRARSMLAWFVCSLSLFLSVICSPNFLALTPVVVISAFFFRGELTLPPRRDALQHLAWMVLAGAAAFLVFLGMIHFELGPFLSTFERFSSMNRGLVYAAFAVKAKKVVAYYAGVTIVTFGVLFAVKLKPEWMDLKLTWPMIIAFLFGLAGVLATYFSSAKGYLWLDSYLSLLLFWIIFHLTGPAYRVYGLAIIALLPFFIHRGATLEELVELPLASPHLHQPELVDQANALHPARIYVDTFALAAAYDYKLPPNVFDINCPLETLFARPKSLRDFPPNSVLIISPVYMTGDSYGYILPEKLSQASHHGVENPYNFVELPAP